MTVWNLLAPGPSASRELAESLRGTPLGVIGNAFELAPWAEFLAASDMHWWRKHPAAHEFTGRKFSMHIVPNVARIELPVVNSGVLGLEVAKRLGASEIRLYGFDFGLGHFFGPYTNGLKNTTQEKRRLHLKQFKYWGKVNKSIRVINCTPGSALNCFPMRNDEDILRAEISAERTGTERVHCVAGPAECAAIP
jgi:hypothetical protein